MTNNIKYHNFPRMRRGLVVFLIPENLCKECFKINAKPNKQTKKKFKKRGVTFFLKQMVENLFICAAAYTREITMQVT